MEHRASRPAGSADTHDYISRLISFVGQFHAIGLIGLGRFVSLPPDLAIIAMQVCLGAATKTCVVLAPRGANSELPVALLMPSRLRS